MDAEHSSSSIEVVIEDARLAKCTCEIRSSSLINSGCNAKQTLSALAPSDALEMASKSLPNSCFVAELVNQIEGNNQFPTNDLISMLLKLVEQASQSRSASEAGGFIQWAIPLDGIHKIIKTEPVKTLLQHGRALDSRISQLQNAIPKLLSSIWKSIEIIRGHQIDHGASPLGFHTAIQVLNLFFGSLSDHEALLEHAPTDTTVNLIAFCWLNTSLKTGINSEGSVALRADLLCVILRFLGLKMHDKDYVLRTGRRLFSTYSLELVDQRIAHRLREEKLLGPELDKELNSIDIFSYYVTQAIIEQLKRSSCRRTHNFPFSGIHLQIIEATHRQLASQAGGEDPLINLSIVLYASRILLNYLGCSGPEAPAVLRELVENAHFSGVLASTLLLLENDSLVLPAKVVHEACQSWDLLVSWILHPAVCRESGCWLKGTPDYLDLTRQIFENIYPKLWSVFRPVRKPGQTGNEPPEKEAIALFRDFCRTLYVRDNTSRERLKLLRRCCNFGCPSRIEGRKPWNKYCCSRCETVYYCDRACQKMDWDTHKSKCDSQLYATTESLHALYLEPWIIPFQVAHRSQYHDILMYIE